MRLIEEEADLRLFEITDFGKLLVELGKHPQQKRGVHKRRLNQTHAVKDVNVPLAIGIDLQPVVDVKRRLTEEDVSTSVF